HYQPHFGPHDQQLIEMLRSPVAAAPHSIKGQLEYITTNWGELLGDLLSPLLVGIDLLEEELQTRTGGPGPVEAYTFNPCAAQEVPDRFSPDSNWMPRLVLLAKNSYVWLNQLSAKYHSEISRLDQIPDEELDLLASQGITGLWMIGLWQRSRASQSIKQMMGDPEAIASAYSLDDYQIADDLGGKEAIENLRARAFQRGIRMASDMVPNHMGVDSRWIADHPEWFLGLDQSPYPTYTFTGPNLTQKESLGIYLEDSYYNRSDAAVVFKRVDFKTGKERYLYHGNDGTFLPWNDTAQLDFSQAAVREAVIQTILKVAEQFPIIRFDAAMTLAKEHIQRLWFPPPGQGGAIPSRSGKGMSQAEFDQAIPQEFWREVVDRVAEEAPDTLLLAEAFWMMEGYFVRALGMHRVYNSAFMHMLRDEHNQKYRQLIKNTLEFNPQILKRYVNFMSNPDEETAAGQFGKGDKYFGVAIVMATMPGLPMVGHGQIEGFIEKYGMEYHRPKLEEQTDQELYARHQQLIFPLFQQRKLFAGVENYSFYDLFASSGHVNEEVLAYSNRDGEQRTLVVYHNRFADTRGWIKQSVAFRDENDHLTQRTLAEGLNLPDLPDRFVIFRDHVTDLEYIRNCKEIHQDGLFLELHAYQANVFLDFRVVDDLLDGSYRKITEHLNGRPVKRISDAMEEILLQVIHQPYRELVNQGMFDLFLKAVKSGSRKAQSSVISQVAAKSETLLTTLSEFSGIEPKIGPPVKKIKKLVSELFKLSQLAENYPYPRGRKYKQLVRQLENRLEDDRFAWHLLFSYIFTAPLGKLVKSRGYAETSLAWMDNWLLGKVIEQTFRGLDLDPQAACSAAGLARLLVGQQDWIQLKASKTRKPHLLMKSWLEDEQIRAFLGVNTYQEIEWFNQEAIEDWLWWMQTIGVLETMANPKIRRAEIPQRLVEVYDGINPIRKAIEASEFQVEKLLSLLKPGKKS
ncbi:MAG: alpha-amylase family glycosyl hydrolase, partial [Chloroflexota bacterium]